MAWDVEQAIGAMKSYLDVQEQRHNNAISGGGYDPRGWIWGSDDAVDGALAALLLE